MSSPVSCVILRLESGREGELGKMMWGGAKRRGQRTGVSATWSPIPSQPPGEMEESGLETKGGWGVESWEETDLGRGGSWFEGRKGRLVEEEKQDASRKPSRDLQSEPGKISNRSEWYFREFLHLRERTNQ